MWNDNWCLMNWFSNFSKIKNSFQIKYFFFIRVNMQYNFFETKKYILIIKKKVKKEKGKKSWTFKNIYVEYFKKKKKNIYVENKIRIGFDRLVKSPELPLGWESPPCQAGRVEAPYYYQLNSTNPWCAKTEKEQNQPSN